MKKYKPSKRAAVFIYLLLTVVLALITGAIFALTPLFGKYDIYVAAVYWLLHAFFSCIMIPIYFRQSSITVSDSEIVHTSGMLTMKSEYMPINSVKSVTTIITPFGGLTGLNFIIINALGSRIILSFMCKKDCLEATKYVNNIISRRS